MAIDVRELSNRILDPVITEELDTYERTVQEYLDGRVVAQRAQEQRRHPHRSSVSTGTRRTLRIRVARGIILQRINRRTRPWVARINLARGPDIPDLYGGISARNGLPCRS